MRVRAGRGKVKGGFGIGSAAMSDIVPLASNSNVQMYVFPRSLEFALSLEAGLHWQAAGSVSYVECGQLFNDYASNYSVVLNALLTCCGACCLEWSQIDRLSTSITQIEHIAVLQF